MTPVSAPALLGKAKCPTCQGLILLAKSESHKGHFLRLNPLPNPEGWVMIGADGIAIVADRDTLEILYPDMPRYIPHAFTCQRAPAEGGAR